MLVEVIILFCFVLFHLFFIFIHLDIFSSQYNIFSSFHLSTPLVQLTYPLNKTTRRIPQTTLLSTIHYPYNATTLYSHPHTYPTTQLRNTQTHQSPKREEIIASSCLFLTLFTALALLHAVEIAITTLYPWKVREFAEEEEKTQKNGGIFKILNEDITRVLTTILVTSTAASIYGAYKCLCWRQCSVGYWWWLVLVGVCILCISMSFLSSCCVISM